MKRCPSSMILVLVLASLIISYALAGGSASAAAGAPPPGHNSRPDGVFVVRVYYDTPGDIGRLAAFDLFEYNNHQEQYVLAAVDRAGLQALRTMGFRAVVDEEETAGFARLLVPLAGQSGAAGIESIPRYDCYRTVEETYAAAEAIVAAHPDLATWSDAGDSWEKVTVTNPDLAGYDMMVLKLTNPASTGDKPKLFVTASIHAREYAPAELATRFAEYLVDNYDVDADATWILDHHEIHLMLQANPDGRKKAEGGTDWRKNTDRDDGCSSSYGTDLNRNFSYQWGTGGSSTVSCNETYRGPSAGSEPETRVVQDYLKATFVDRRGTGAAPSDTAGLYLDLHSYGGYVIWPWGYTTADMPSPNNTQHQTLGRKFAYFNGYSPFQIADGLYIASGGSIDYAYGELGVASLCFEVGTAFFQSCTTFESTIYPTNLQALIYAAKVARTPYQTPLGPDALTLSLAPAPDPGGEATLSATINDTRYRSGTGEPTQAIAAAEYYIDTPPWQAGAVVHAMTAADGVFNGSTEGVTAAVETSGLAPGRHIIFVRGKDAGGNWGAFSAIFLAGPLAVELAAFSADATADGVLLAWETVSDAGVAGFNLYRAASSAGPWTRINDALIPAQAPGAASGGSYAFTDTAAPQGGTAWYLLEDVALSGAATRHEPVSVTLAGPNAVGMAGFGAAATAASAAAAPALAGLVATLGLAAAAGARRRK